MKISKFCIHFALLFLKCTTWYITPSVLKGKIVTSPCNTILRFKITCRFGPLVHFWCMRFEGKHSYFKDLAQRVRCYKNIPKTLSRCHQHMMSYTFGTASISTSPFGKDTTRGVCKFFTYCKCNLILILCFFPQYSYCTFGFFISR